jgi:phosphopantothenoylcysteine synthetase/decarboxylase
MVGFAAETQDLIDNAKKKLESKNLDFIVVAVKTPVVGTGSQRVARFLFSSNGNKKTFTVNKRPSIYWEAPKPTSIKRIHFY